jgi:hypothetical protein
VEIKGWRGGIEGDDYTWTVAGEFVRPNPWPTVNNKARVLKSSIENKQPAIGSFWVEAVVVIADEQGGLNLQGNNNSRVFKYLEVPTFLKDPAVIGKDNNLRPV